MEIIPGEVYRRDKILPGSSYTNKDLLVYIGIDDTYGKFIFLFFR